MIHKDLVHPDKDFRNIYNPFLSTNNTVFQGSIVAYQCNQKDHVALGMPASDWALWHLINLGVQDMPAIDKPWDASTRAMRFSTCLADHLWVMIEREHNRVCAFCLFMCEKIKCAFLE